MLERLSESQSFGVRAAVLGAGLFYGLYSMEINEGGAVPSTPSEETLLVEKRTAKTSNEVDQVLSGPTEEYNPREEAFWEVCVRLESALRHHKLRFFLAPHPQNPSMASLLYRKGNKLYIIVSVEEEFASPEHAYSAYIQERKEVDGLWELEREDIIDWNTNVSALGRIREFMGEDAPAQPVKMEPTPQEQAALEDY